MDPRFSEFSNFNGQSLFPDMLNQYPIPDPFEDLSFFDPNSINSVLSSSLSHEGDDGEFSDSMLKHRSQVLTESDPCLFHDPFAFQATDESLNEVTGGGKYPTSQDQNPLSFDQNIYGNVNGDGKGILVSKNELLLQFNRGAEEGRKFLPIVQLVSAKGNKPYAVADRKAGDDVVINRMSGGEHVRISSRGKKNHRREEIDLDGGRSNKQSAVYMDDEEGELSDIFDKVFLCKPIESKDDQVCQNGANNFLQQEGQCVGIGNEKARGKKEVIDLRDLLILCAEAVAADDRETASELLKQIMEHSSPLGDCAQRLAHCFANALEARLAGTGTQIYTALSAKRKSAADVLKFYQVYIAACPFMKMLMIFANHMILKAAEKAETLHIIDFGIRYGFQWPALIHGLSRRSGGPPKLRITGVELPLCGFRPDGTVQETGHRLTRYCKRFNVPFEYHAIAKEWETLQFDDLKVQRNEVLAVNCLCRFKYLLDETVVVNSPRDTVLNLIRQLNPDIFVQSVVSGSLRAPFFVPRFRETLFHFSALFEMLDTNFTREDQMRLEFEKELIGREVMNIVSCEGSKRIARPETYKQWQIRNRRAGFRQLPLDREVVNQIRDKVKMGYHPCFLVDEDERWMLQGWKGRILYGSACWVPSKF